MRKFRKRLSFVLAALFVSGLTPYTALAEGEGGNPGVKLTRGLTNLVTGWLEVPVQMAEQKKMDSTTSWWIPHGFIRGLGVAGARTLYGAWDMITFPVAPYNKPVMDPDTLIKPKAKPRALEPLPPAAE